MQYFQECVRQKNSCILLLRLSMQSIMYQTNFSGVLCLRVPCFIPVPPRPMPSFHAPPYHQTGPTSIPSIPSILSIEACHVVSILSVFLFSRPPLCVMHYPPPPPPRVSSCLYRDIVAYPYETTPPYLYITRSSRILLTPSISPSMLLRSYADNGPAHQIFV